eukprot:SAG31_NODE_9364_length_1289_cov_2.126891_1_plen_61_part_00
MSAAERTFAPSLPSQAKGNGGGASGLRMPRTGRAAHGLRTGSLHGAGRARALPVRSARVR